MMDLYTDTRLMKFHIMHSLYYMLKYAAIEVMVNNPVLFKFKLNTKSSWRLI